MSVATFRFASRGACAHGAGDVFLLAGLRLPFCDRPTRRIQRAQKSDCGCRLSSISMNMCVCACVWRCVLIERDCNCIVLIGHRKGFITLRVRARLPRRSAWHLASRSDSSTMCLIDWALHVLRGEATRVVQDAQTWLCSTVGLVDSGGATGMMRRSSWS